MWYASVALLGTETGLVNCEICRKFVRVSTSTKLEQSLKVAEFRQCSGLVPALRE